MSQLNILLTSNGLSNLSAQEIVKKFVEISENKTAVIITTAARDKENNKWVIVTKEQFLELGYERVDFLDLEIYQKIDLSPYATVYVAGGNTFKLLKFVQESNFKEEVIKLLNNNGLYIGASAGAIILTPTIRIAGEITPDENLVNIENLEGINLVNFELLPHYEPELLAEVEKYRKKTSNEVKLISNEEVLYLKYEEQ